jgi:hypothetical protein
VVDEPREVAPSGLPYGHAERFDQQ